jgi:acyl-CoA synthetase (AMP-forming)/AMP-acid ligase II
MHETPRSIPALAGWAAARYGDDEAVVDGSTRLSFRDVADLASRATRSAMRLGVQPGDRVAIWAPNRWEWMVAALGALGAGAWLVPLNTRFKGAEAAYVLERADATVLFTVKGFLGTDYLEMLRAEAPQLRCLDTAVWLDAHSGDGALAWDDFLAIGDDVAERTARERVEAIEPDDIADIIFTSGTTGRPKGAMLRHGASLHFFDLWSRAFGLRRGDRYAIVNPFFHCFGYKGGWMSCLLQGATALPIAALDVDRLLHLIETERVSALPGPPTLFWSLLERASAGDCDLSSLRIGFVGATTVPAELLRRVRDELPFRSLTTGYGLTEAHALVSITKPDDDPERISAWNAGFPLPGIDVCVVDDQHTPVSAGTDGEIMVRGANVMSGYYEDDTSTADAIEPDGWLHTGDIGALSERGDLRITDRKKDIFICGGFNVSPAEVEGLLLSLEGIAQIAVIGIPDQRLGEVGSAFVVPAPGVELTPEAVIAWARDHIANYKVPRRVEIVDALPMNASGKVVKGELRARLDSTSHPIIVQRMMTAAKGDSARRDA